MDTSNIVKLTTSKQWKDLLESTPSKKDISMLTLIIMMLVEFIFLGFPSCQAFTYECDCEPATLLAMNWDPKIFQTIRGENGLGQSVLKMFSKNCAKYEKWVTK